MKNSNYKILFALRTLKSISNTFIDSFLVLYFIQLSNNSILPFGIYKIVCTCVVFITIFLLRNINKSKNRVFLLRLGIIFHFIYFITIILLREKVVDYMYLVGIIYGLEEGFYYSITNVYESEGVDNKERTKFTGNYYSVKAVLSIIFPLIFGGLIASGGFLKSIFLVLLLTTIRIILSMYFKDTNIPKSKANLKHFFGIVKKTKNLKQLLKTSFFNGFIYSSGAFGSIVTIYIIKVFSDSVSLGIFTSIFSLLTFIMGILFANYIKKHQYPNLIKTSMSLTIISLIAMVVNCNMITVIIFNFFQVISSNFIGLINGKSEFDIANVSEIKKEYKVEYFVVHDMYLCFGRIFGYTLFILMLVVSEMIIISVFIIILILLTYNSIKLQKMLLKS